MAKSKVSVEDRLEVNDVLARYCWYTDEGDAEAWADLWTEDGVFAGTSREPIRGREALKGVPPTSIAAGARHNIINIIAEYGETTDEIVVRAYNLVHSWMNGGAVACNAVALYRLVRRGDTWKIKSNQVRLQTPRDSGQLPPGFPTPANQPTTWPPI